MVSVSHLPLLPLDGLQMCWFSRKAAVPAASMLYSSCKLGITTVTVSLKLPPFVTSAVQSCSVLIRGALQRQGVLFRSFQAHARQSMSQVDRPCLHRPHRPEAYIVPGAASLAVLHLETGASVPISHTHLPRPGKNCPGMESETWLRLADGQALRSPITTHMLDTARGQPAQGVPVQLLRGYDTGAHAHAGCGCRSWRSWWHAQAGERQRRCGA